MRGIECPKCHRPGSIHTRWVLNSKKKKFEPYYYVAHWDPEEKRPKWHYVPKAFGEVMYSALSNSNKKTLEPLSNTRLKPEVREDSNICSDPLGRGCKERATLSFLHKGQVYPLCGTCHEKISESDIQW